MPVSNLSIRADISFETFVCGTCGVEYAVRTEFVKKLRESHATFHCPNGHGAHFPAKTEAEILKEKLSAAEASAANLKKRTEWAEENERKATKERDAAKAEAARLRKRAQNGACPCCKRTFSNLARHMAIKHPTSPEAGQAAKNAEREDRETASPRSKA